MFLSPVTRGFTTSCLRRSRIGPLSFSASGIPIIGSLNCRFAGSITGGIEGIQTKIPAMNRKLLGKFSLLVSEYAFSGILSPRIIREFRKPLRSQPPAEAETEYMNNTFLHQGPEA